MFNQLILTAIPDFPLVNIGSDLGQMISEGLKRANIVPEQGDIVVIAQKVVSKAEGRTVDLNTVVPSSAACELAADTGKDPRVVELILVESKSVIRKKLGVIIVEHKRGWIMANAGIDASNVASNDGANNVLLLPLDPDRSAEKLRVALKQRFGYDFGIVISDSFGRPWRLGTTGVAIGAAGLPSLWDRRGDEDLFGRDLKVTQLAVGDEVATAASLLQGQASEGQPVVHLRGLNFHNHESARSRPASDLIRDVSEDMFR